MSLVQKLKMKKIGQLVANLHCLEWMNKLAFLKNDKHT